VVDSISGQPVIGATVQVINPAQNLTTDGQGEFILTGVSILDIELVLSADGYGGRVYNITASRAIGFKLSL
jgi:hypothetical protein